MQAACLARAESAATGSANSTCKILFGQSLQEADLLILLAHLQHF